MGQRKLTKILLICLVVILVGIATYFLATHFLLIHDLRAAPESIEINGTEYTLEAWLNRDFMPICPPGGRPLLAIVRVEAPGETAISSKIDATRLWVVKGTEIWETEFASWEGPTRGDTLEKVGRDGPKWRPGISVDVVVRIIDLKSGENYLLRASNQVIRRSS